MLTLVPAPTASVPTETEPNDQRVILHVDLDCFFVSVERVLDPALSNVPVIVGGDPDSRGVVTSASREARAEGVHAGMPSAVAHRLCPDAVFVQGRGRMYGRASAAAMKIMRSFCSEMERASIDEAYLDVTDRVDGVDGAFDIAVAIQRALQDRLGLPCSIGIGRNKFISKVACARAKPIGILEVWPGYEEAFVSPLEVGELPGIGPVLAEQLRLFGLRTASDLARVSPDLLEANFGTGGRSLLRKAQGLGDDKVEEGGPPKSLGHETTFSKDVRDSGSLVESIFDLAQGVSKRAKKHRLMGRTITLKLRTADFKTVTRARTIATPTDDASQLANIACFLLREAWDGESPVRLVGVTLARLGDEPVQQPLFPGGVTESDERVDAEAGAGTGYPWHALLPPALSRSGVRGSGSWALLPGEGAWSVGGGPPAKRR
jgi:DNA polymerase-4